MPLFQPPGLTHRPTEQHTERDRFWPIHFKFSQPS